MVRYIPTPWPTPLGTDGKTDAEAWGKPRVRHSKESYTNWYKLVNKRFIQDDRPYLTVTVDYIQSLKYQTPQHISPRRTTQRA